MLNFPNKLSLLPNEENDEGGFSDKGSSNLLNLFSDEPQTLTKDLQYKPQAQPITQTQNSAPTSKLFFSTVATGYRYDTQTKQYVTLGQLGAAILKQSNQNINNFQIIIYKNKTQYLVIENLSEEFKFSVQVNNYLSFVSKNISWSLRLVV